MKVVTDFELTTIRHLILGMVDPDDAALLHLADKFRSFPLPVCV
jgi:hypothetical protein